MEGEETEKKEIIFLWQKNVQRKLIKSFPDVKLKTLKKLHKNIYEEFHKLDWKNKERTLLFYGSLKDFYLHFSWKIKWKNESHLVIPCVQLLYYMSCIVLRLSNGTSATDRLNEILLLLKNFPGDAYLICDVLLLIRNVKQKSYPAYAAIAKFILKDEDLQNPDAECFIKMMLLFRRLICFSTNCVEKADISSLALTIKRPPDVVNWLSSLSMDGLGDITLKNVAQKFLKKKLKHKFIQKLFMILFEKKYDKEILNPERFSPQKFMLSNDNDLKNSKQKINRKSKIELHGKYPKKQSHKKIKKMETTKEVQLGKLKIESCTPHSYSARNKKHKNNLALTMDRNKASKLLSSEIFDEKIRENSSEYVRSIEMHKDMLKTNESSEHLTSNSQKTKKRSLSQIEDSFVKTVSLSSHNKKRKGSDSVNGEFGERIGVSKESEVHLAKSSDGHPTEELISFVIGESCKGHKAGTSSLVIGEHLIENIEKSEQMMPNCRSPTLNVHVSVELEKSLTSNAVFDNKCNIDNESCNVDSENLSISNNKSELSVQRNFSFQGDDVEYCNEVNDELLYQKSHESSDLVSAKDFWGNASSRKRKCTIVSDKRFESTGQTKCSIDPSTESLPLIQNNHNFPNSQPTLPNGVSNDFISTGVEDEEINMTDECDISSNNVLKGSHLAIAQSSPLHSITGTTENAIEKYIVNENESSSFKIRNGICPLPVRDKNDALTLNQEKQIPLELQTGERKDGTKYQHYFLYDSETNTVTKPSPIFSSPPSCKHSLHSSPESLDLKNQSHVSTTSVNVDILEKSRSIYTSSDFSETVESNISLSSPTKNLQALSKEPVSDSETFHSLSESNSIIQTPPSSRRKKAKKHQVKSKQFISDSDSDSSGDEQNAARQTIPIMSIGTCCEPVVNSKVSSLQEKKRTVSKKTSLCSSENSPSQINDEPVNAISNSKSFSSSNLKSVCSNQLNSVEVLSSSSSNSPDKKVSSTPNNSKVHTGDSPLNANSESHLQPSLALNSNSSGKKYFLRSSPKLQTLGLRSEKCALKSDLNNTLESNHSNSIHSASNTTFESNSSARNDLESDSASDDSNQNVDPKRFIDWSASEADPDDLMSELEGDSDQNFIANSSDCSDLGDQCVSDSSERALSHKSVSTHNSACSSRDSSPICIRRKSHRQNISSSSSASSSENSSHEQKRKSTKIIYKKCIVESSENESGDEVVTDDGNKILDHKLVFRNSSGSFLRNSSLDQTRKSNERIVCNELNTPEWSTSETLNISNPEMNKEKTQIRKCVVVIEDCIASQKYSVSPSSKNRVVETDDTKGNDLCVSNDSEGVLNQKYISQENSACSLKNASPELRTGSHKMLPKTHMECDSNASDELYASNNSRQMPIDDIVYKNSQDLFPTLCFESNKQQSAASESNVNVSALMKNSSSLSENSMDSAKRSYCPRISNTSYFSDSDSSISPHQHVSSDEEMSDKKLLKVRKLPRKSNSSQKDLSKKYQTTHPLSSTEDEFSKTRGYIHSDNPKCKLQKRKKICKFRNDLNKQYENIHPLTSTEIEFDKSYGNIHSNAPRYEAQEREKTCKLMKSKNKLDSVSSESPDQHVSSDVEFSDKKMHKVKKLPKKSNRSENDLNRKYQTTHPLSSTEDEFGKTRGNIHSDTPKCKSQKRKKSRTFRNNLNKKHEIVHPLSSTEDEFDKSHENIHSNTPTVESQEREKSCKIMKSKKNLESVSSASPDQHVSSDEELLDKNMHKVKKLPRKSNSSENDLNKKKMTTHPLSSTEDEFGETRGNIHLDTPKYKSQKRKTSRTFQNNLNKKYEIVHPLSSTEDEFDKSHGNIHSNTPRCESQEREKSFKIMKSKKNLESVSSASPDQHVTSDEELLDKKMDKVKKLPRKSNSAENDLNKKYQTTHPLSSTENEFSKKCGNINLNTPKRKSQIWKKSRTFQNNLNKMYEIIHPLSSTLDEFDKKNGNSHSNTPKSQEMEKSCKIMKSKKILESDVVEQNVLNSKNPLSFKLPKETTPANCSKDMPLSEVIKQMEGNTEANLIDSPNLCLNSSLEQLHEKNLHECSQRNGNASKSLEDSSFSAIHQEINNNFSLTFQKSENAFINLTESAQPEEKAKRSAEESVKKLKEKRGSSGCASEKSLRVESPGSLFVNVLVPETENLSSCNQQLSDIEKGASSQFQPNTQDLFSLVKEWCKKNGISACTRSLSCIQSDPEKRNMSHENVTLANEEYLLVKFMEELQGDSSLVTSEDHIHQSFLNYFLDSVEDKNGSLPSLDNNTLEYLHDLAKTKSEQKSDMSFKTENLGNFPINNAENLKVGSNETSNSRLSNSFSKAKCEVLIISPRKKCNLNWNQNQEILDLNTPSKAFRDQNDSESVNYPKRSTDRSCSQQSCEFDVDMNETSTTEQNITQNCYSKSNNFAPETYFDQTTGKQSNRETSTGMVDYQNQCSSDNAIEQNEKKMHASHIKKKSCRNSSVPAASISHLSNISKCFGTNGTLDSTSIKCCVSICSSVSKCNNKHCGGSNISVDKSNGLFVNASAGHIFGNGLNLSSTSLFPVVNLGKRCDKIALNSASNPEIKSHSISIDRTCENQTLRPKKLTNSYLKSKSVIKKENNFSKPALRERSVGMHKHSSKDSNSQTNDESEHQKPTRYNLRLRRRVT